jgi:succinate dehydrogenase / fumarate reductase membrane anchor subunit
MEMRAPGEMRTPLGRVRGLGSAKEGVGHWWAQRLTGLALIPLTLWFVYAAISLVGADLTDFRIWAGEHGNVVLMILFIVALFHHAQLGVQVIVEDYVHSESAKIAGVVATKSAALVLGLSCILAVLHLVFGS